MSEESSSWLSRLKSGLSKTSTRLGDSIISVVTKRPLDEEMLSELEISLIQADIGAAPAAKIIAGFRQKRFDKTITAQEARLALGDEIAMLLTPVAQPLVVDHAIRPYVILMVGVNGNGKTTTIGKLAASLKSQKYKVMMAAVDTFRAAAVEQLKVWGARTACEVITGAPGADPASVAYRAMEEARAKGMDVLLIDSAGRLQNKTNLMEELQKIIKVIKKVDAGAPHAVVLVLDATTGQNALSQVEVFSGMVGVTGLIVTKLDGTAKGGIVVAIADRFALPVHAIGVGEGIEDLRSFTGQDFARALLG